MTNEAAIDAKATLASLRQQIDAIDAEMNRLVDLLVADKISPTLVQVQEINLRARRDSLQNLFNSVHASIKHF